MVMTQYPFRSGVAALVVCLVLSACGGAPAPGPATPAPAGPSGATQASPVGFQGEGYPHTTADVAFMTGMIHHHAQAVLIAGWAPSHGASRSLQALCERIVVGQQDEIALAARWLRSRKEPVPNLDPAHAMHTMDHAVMMPGMLTPDQLSRLDLARGPDFDRLFLEYMIMHHQGAITMVDQLFGAQGAGQDETVFRFASDVYADQTTEIRRMQGMLAELSHSAASP
jgi:uncharacterized protein (DUF305 family)